MKPRDLLVDADVLVYAFAHRNQTNTTFRLNGDGPRVVTPIAHLDKAWREVRDFVSDLRAKLQASTVYMCLSDTQSNFRKDLYPPYKANRTAPRPALYEQLRGEIADYGRWEWQVYDSLEADDLLGILATALPLEGREPIICTIDKDLRTVPGLHYNWDHPDESIVTVTQDEADRFFLFQTLTGDSTDGYPGAKGVGPVGANRVLDAVDPWDFGEAWAAVVRAFEKSGAVASDAIMQARMARILTDPSGAVELWTPPPTPADDDDDGEETQ